MAAEREKTVIAAFDAAAESYDAWTQVQRDIARALVARVQSKPKTILDIGAGTGHVTELARTKWPGAKIAALDAAPNMLAKLKKKFPEVETIRADAAEIASAQKFDLILSSMALHWLPEPAQALRRWQNLLSPGGLLHVALPVQGSLGEWRDFLRAQNLMDTLWPFPAADFAPGEIAEFRATFESPLAFARSLKKSGAHTAKSQNPPTALRKILLARQGEPFSATFTIKFLRIAP